MLWHKPQVTCNSVSPETTTTKKIFYFGYNQSCSGGKKPKILLNYIVNKYLSFVEVMLHTGNGKEDY